MSYLIVTIIGHRLINVEGNRRADTVIDGTRLGFTHHFSSPRVDVDRLGLSWLVGHLTHLISLLREVVNR